MIDNIGLIKPLLKFSSEDDFYFLQIMQRRKDNDQLSGQTRVVKNYYIRNLEYLDDRYSEIKGLCERFNARAGIRLNRRSYKHTALRTMVNLANIVADSTYEHANKVYDRACGKSAAPGPKSWILDVDEQRNLNLHDPMFELIEQQQPADIKKFVAAIPSRTGWHVITKPFDTREFVKQYPGVSIHKDNPTNLYIPDDCRD